MKNYLPAIALALLPACYVSKEAYNLDLQRAHESQAAADKQVLLQYTSSVIACAEKGGVKVERKSADKDNLEWNPETCLYTVHASPKPTAPAAANAPSIQGKVAGAK